jgi:ribonucleoside-diphosphate reductase alpha chain
MTSAKRTAVCCLSSLNLDKFDEWKDTTIVEDLVRYLDNVLEYFIRLSPHQLKRAIYSASKERAIGLGTLGMCSYLQRNKIPYESGGIDGTASHLYRIYSLIKQRAINSSKQLASERGEAPDCEGSGMRNSHLLAIAPNASSSDMVGVSPSIEPFAANAFLSEGRAGSFLVKNKHLEEELSELGLNTPEIWGKIEKDRGSVQNIDEIPDWIKQVYKTFSEINPKWIIENVSVIQEHICQGISTNIKVGKGITLQEMSDIHILAWKKGLKTLYYCRAEKPLQIKLGSDNILQPLNKVEVNINFEECLSCSG